MNHPFVQLTKTFAQTVTPRSVCKKLGVSLGLALLIAVPVIKSAGDTPARSPGRTEITGNFDWSIIPANLVPPFIFVGNDGDFYVRHLPLVGPISITGRDVSIEGKISADFNAELDATFSGPVWASVTITGTVNGSTILLFEGNATGDTIALVSTGVIKLNGHGPYAGRRLEIEFAEIGPGNTDTYSLTGNSFQARHIDRIGQTNPPEATLKQETTRKGAPCKPIG